MSRKPVTTQREAKERSDERRDMKAQVVIRNKETDEIVHRADKYYDEAERYARNYIWGRPYLAYKVYHVVD